MNTLHTRSAAAIMTAAVMTLSSCSLKRSIVANSSREIVVAPTISFSWWGSETRNSYTLHGLTIFEQDTGDTLEVVPYPYDFDGYKSNLDALLRCGKECDLMQLNSFWLKPMVEEYDALYDLNELKDYIALQNYSAEELSYCTIDGKLYGIPTSLNAVTFYHNNAVYAKYGIKPPETWEDLFAAAKVFSPHNVYVLESHPKHYWLMLIAHEEQITGKASFDDGFDSENIISMMQFYKELRDQKVIPVEDYNRDMFIDGKCASEALWVSDADYYAVPVSEHRGLLQVGAPLCTQETLEFVEQKREETEKKNEEGGQNNTSPHRSSPVPDEETQQYEKLMFAGWYVKPNQVYSIKKNTEHPEETASLLNFLVNDSRMAELQGTEKGVPLSRSALEVLEGNGMLKGTSYEAGKLVNDNLTYFRQMPDEIEETERYEAFFEQYMLFENGEKTVEQAADDFIALYPFK